MTDDNSGEWLSSDDVFVDLGEKVRRGYDPEAVDRHLEVLAAGIKALRREVDSGGHVDDESLGVMMRAGRRSVEEALEEARARADVILADAERDAAKCLAEADSKADEICSGAEQEAHRHEETVEIRRIEVAALDEEIEMRQNALRTAAAELLQLADGIIDDADIDLRALDGPGSADADESLTT
jgi:hypothetical protein